MGDRVKVIGGQHAGQSGLLLQVREELCIMISDTTKSELKVFAR